MPAVQETIDRVRKIDVDQYKYGFETSIETDKAPKGLNEDIIRLISAKKDEPEWMLEWRLGAFRRWLTLEEPTWARVHYPKIDFQDIHYYAAPKSTPGPTSLDDVDPELLKVYAKLGIPLKEQEILAGVRKAGEPSAVRSRQRQWRRAAPRRGRRRVRFRFGRDDLQGRARQGRRHLLLDLRSDPRASGAGEEVSRHRRADDRQLSTRR